MEIGVQEVIVKRGIVRTRLTLSWINRLNLGEKIITLLLHLGAKVVTIDDIVCMQVENGIGGIYWSSRSS